MDFLEIDNLFFLKIFDYVVFSIFVSDWLVLFLIVSIYLPMVVKRNSRSLGYPQQPPKESSGKFIKDAFTHSLTIYPLDADSIPERYSPAMIFLFMISVLASGVFMAFQLVKNPPTDNSIISNLSHLGLVIFSTFVSFSVLCYLYSFIGSLILGIDHNSKQYSINASSFTYILIAFILIPLMPNSISTIPELAAWFLMSYYIGLNYRSYYIADDERKRTIHGIYIYIGYLAMSLLCFMVPAQTYKVIKEMI